MLVWDNGSTGTASLSYRTWNGTIWSAAQTITTPVSGEAVQLRLAADPNSDSMVLAVAGTPGENDYALVWNGSSWGNAVTLDTSTGSTAPRSTRPTKHTAGARWSSTKRTAPPARSTTASGTATSWSAQSSLAAPAGIGAANDANLSVMASDPGSNRIALGVITDVPRSGSRCGMVPRGVHRWPLRPPPRSPPSPSSASPSSTTRATCSPPTARTAATSSSTAPGRRGRSAESTGPNVGGVPQQRHAVRRSAFESHHARCSRRPADVNFAEWTGSAWGAPTAT